MALQTREQHIRRETATSNICTAQALLAIMAGMYGVYHGANGIKNIALRLHNYACIIKKELHHLGYKLPNEHFFDTLYVDTRGKDQLHDFIHQLALNKEINFHYDGTGISIALDETVQPEDLVDIVNVFAAAHGKDDYNFDIFRYTDQQLCLPNNLIRTSAYLTHPVFNSHRSESQLMRYMEKFGE